MPRVPQVESLEQARIAAGSHAETTAQELEQVLATRAQALRTSKVMHLEVPYCLLSGHKSSSIHVYHEGILKADSCIAPLDLRAVSSSAERLIMRKVSAPQHAMFSDQ